MSPSASVIASWLLGLTAAALVEEVSLRHVAGGQRCAERPRGVEEDWEAGGPLLKMRSGGSPRERPLGDNAEHSHVGDRLVAIC